MEIRDLSKILTMGVLLASVAGCQSIENLNKKYQKVVYNDGINYKEAKLIAQQRMMKSVFTQKFSIFEPYVLLNEETRQYANFWFVVFPPKDELSPFQHIVVVDKVSGGVVRATNYRPVVQDGVDWLFK